ncbi:hypothetical protein [uncultured Hoeflea sp.]|uniref:hypothetical protein n=1 Tax=uncultured Hoeflea sp. TaxID=538666 RepID=UPI002623412D|nr:hypothetical protein [uncultured Hoeflea sp.]
MPTTRRSRRLQLAFIALLLSGGTVLAQAQEFGNEPLVPDWTGGKVAKDQGAVPDVIGDGVGISAGLTKAARLKDLSKGLGGLDTLFDVSEIGNELSDGDVAGAVGKGVEAAVGRYLVPACAFTGGAAGAVVGGGASAGVLAVPGAAVGAVGGAAFCQKRARDAGQMAENVVRPVADLFIDDRPELIRRLEQAGIDRNEFFDRNLNGSVYERDERLRVEAEMFRELSAREGEMARARGESFFPDPVIKQRIAEIDAHLASKRALASAGSQTPSFIPYSVGRGIKCGPIHSAERTQLRNKYGAEWDNIEHDLKAWRSNLRSAAKSKNDFESMGVNPGTAIINDYENSKRAFEEARSNYRRALIGLREANGRCPAPVGPRAPNPDGATPSGGTAAPGGAASASNPEPRWRNSNKCFKQESYGDVVNIC